MRLPSAGLGLYRLLRIDYNKEDAGLLLQLSHPLGRRAAEKRIFRCAKKPRCGKQRGHYHRIRKQFLS